LVIISIRKKKIIKEFYLCIIFRKEKKNNTPFNEVIQNKFVEKKIENENSLKRNFIFFSLKIN